MNPRSGRGTCQTQPPCALLGKSRCLTQKNSVLFRGNVELFRIIFISFFIVLSLRTAGIGGTEAKSVQSGQLSLFSESEGNLAEETGWVNRGGGSRRCSSQRPTLTRGVRSTLEERVAGPRWVGSGQPRLGGCGEPESQPELSWPLARELREARHTLPGAFGPRPWPSFRPWVTRPPAENVQRLQGYPRPKPHPQL